MGQRNNWTPEEDAQLKKLREVDNLSFSAIAEKINRSKRACATRYHRYVKEGAKRNG